MEDKVAQVGRPEYGGLTNIRCIVELKEVYRRYGHHDPMFAHCIEMVLVKLGRIMTGEYKEDNLTDIQGYLALASSIHQEQKLSQERATYHDSKR
jgi:hypothetical protein